MVRDELIDWAKQRLDRGFTLEQIRTSLEKAGYPPGDINELMNILNQAPPPKTKEEKEEKIQPKQEKGQKKKPEQKKKETGEKKEAKKKVKKEEKKTKRGKKPKTEKKEVITTSPLFDETRGGGGFSFFREHEMGIALFLILIVLLVGIGGIILNTVWQAGNVLTPPQENVVNSIIVEAIQQHQLTGTPVQETINLVSDDYVLAENVSAEVGSTVVFCAGEVEKPSDCDNKTWRVEDPCGQGYSFTGEANQKFFSSDTSQAGFRVVNPVSGTLKVSEVCGSYYIGFKKE